MKFDHSLSGKQKISVTYSDQIRPRLLNNRGWGETSPVLEGYRDQNLHSYMGRINHDYIFRPKLLSHFTFGFDRYHNPTKTQSIGADWNQKLGITGFPWDDGSFPVVDFSGGTASPLGLAGSTRLHHRQRTLLVQREPDLDSRTSHRQVRRRSLPRAQQPIQRQQRRRRVRLQQRDHQPAECRVELQQVGKLLRQLPARQRQSASTLSPITTGWRWHYWSGVCAGRMARDPQLTCRTACVGNSTRARLK